MALPSPPPVPQRGDRVTFSSRVDAFLNWVAAIIPALQQYLSDFMDQLSSLAAGGANSFTYKFSSATADADPGPGLFRLNTSPQNQSTILRIDTVSGGVDISGVIAALVARTSSIKGTIRLQKFNDLNAWMILDVTGFTGGAGYYNLNVSVRASTSANPFTADDTVLVFMDASGEKGAAGSQGYAKFSDRKASGVAGGGAIAGIQDRTLNSTDLNDIPGVSLSGNLVTLSAGTFEIEARAPIYLGGGSRLIVFNQTDGVAIAYGSGQIPGSGEVSTMQINVSGKFTITSPKSIKLQQYNNAAASTVGLGVPISQAGVMEVYAELIVRKIT